MLADRGLPSLPRTVFVGFERKNEHHSRPLEIIGPPKVSTYLPRQMNHPELRMASARTKSAVFDCALWHYAAGRKKFGVEYSAICPDAQAAAARGYTAKVSRARSLTGRRPCRSAALTCTAPVGVCRCKCRQAQGAQLADTFAARPFAKTPHMCHNPPCLARPIPGFRRTELHRALAEDLGILSHPPG